MLPIKGSHPEINVLFIGGHILKTLQSRRHKRMKVAPLLKSCSKELSLSIDHIILGLGWLYVVSAIESKNDEVYLNHEVT